MDSGFRRNDGAFSRGRNARSALLADQPRRLAQSRPAAGDVAAFEMHRDGPPAARHPRRDGTASPVARTLERLLFIDRHFGFPLLPVKNGSQSRV
jgi:hypothetical protein